MDLIIFIVFVFCFYYGVFMMKGCFSVEYLILSNNFKMFMVGFGVFKVIDKEEC